LAQQSVCWIMVIHAAGVHHSSRSPSFVFASLNFILKSQSVLGSRVPECAAFSAPHPPRVLSSAAFGRRPLVYIAPLSLTGI
jgi:hypothetical protein